MRHSDIYLCFGFAAALALTALVAHVSGGKACRQKWAGFETSFFIESCQVKIEGRWIDVSF